MTTEENKQHYERINFGDEVDQFLKSRIGVYLIQLCNKDAVDAFEELKKCNAEDPKAIRALQNKIAIAEQFQDWLIEAVNAGLESLQILEDRS
jgi:hypothetical protein